MPTSEQVWQMVNKLDSITKAGFRQFYADSEENKRKIDKGFELLQQDDSTIQDDVRLLVQKYIEGARSSGDGSGAGPRQPTGSPASSPQTSAKSVKLSDSTFKLSERFPGIRSVAEDEMAAAGDPVSAWSYAAVEYLLLKVVKTIVRWLPSMDLSSEAGLVHLFSRGLAEVTDALQPSGILETVVTDSEPVSTDLVVEQQGDSWRVAFEQNVKAGTFKGRIELQYVREVTAEGKRIYAGAVELKRLKTGNIDEAHVEQASKEAFALWCHNAELGSYHEVWVLLTNGEQVMRVTYAGENVPHSNTAKEYYKKMPCSEIIGTLRVSRRYALWHIPPTGGVDCVRDTRKAFGLFLSTFCTGTPPTLGELQQQDQLRDQELETLVGAFKEHLTVDAPEDIRRKRLASQVVDDGDRARKRPEDRPQDE